MYNNKRLSTYLLLVALLLCVVGQAQAGVTLSMFASSSVWWVAVKPGGDGGKTAKIELKDSASSSSFVALTANQDWGYWSVSASGSAFKLPLTFRLTSSSGATITTTVASIVADQVIDTGATYDGASSTTPTTKPNTAATSAPTTAPTTKPTTAPTTKPTSAPTTAPTTKPTSAPTSAPTTKPTSAPTSAPTTAPSTDLCAVTSVKSEPVKIMVPLYVYPGAAWDALATAASSVKIQAVINPNSGPLSTVDAAYSTYMTKLKNAGVELIGYVYTSYGNRDINLVKADIDLYASKYPLVTGIFLDEGAADASKLSFYTTVYNYIKSKPGYVHVILNPGIVPDQGYLAVTTNIVIYENYGSQLASTTFSNWVKCAPSASQKSGYKYKFTAIVHTTPVSLEASYIQSLATRGVGFVYVTDGAGGCCTYNTLTSYFPQLAASVATVNKG